MLDLKAVFGSPDKTPETEEPSDTPDGPDVATLANVGPPEPSGEPPSFDFSGWVRRPDCNGRMGWEAPDLPEAARWWAR